MSSLSSSYLNKLSSQDKENLFRLISFKEDTQNLMNNKPVLVEREKFGGGDLQQKIEHIDVIKDLREKLEIEMSTNNDLRENIVFIQAKYKQELESLKKENDNLKELAERLNMEFEKLVIENADLTRELGYMGKLAEENQEKSVEMKRNLQNVRELVTLFLKEEDFQKRKDIREQTFLSLISNPDKLIKASEPRSDFPYPDSINSNNDRLIPKVQYERLLVENKSKDNEIKKLQSIISKLEEDVDRIKNNFLKYSKEKGDENTKLKEQLKGAIRRINYLVEEKEKLVKEAKEKNTYVSKLEMKVIQQQTSAQSSNSKPNTSAGQSRGVSPAPQNSAKKAPLNPQKRTSVPNISQNKEFENVLDGISATANSSLKRSTSKSNITRKEGHHKRERTSIDIQSKASKTKDCIDELSSIQLMNYKFEDSPTKKTEEIEQNFEEIENGDHESN